MLVPTNVSDNGAYALVGVPDEPTTIQFLSCSSLYILLRAKGTLTLGKQGLILIIPPPVLPQQYKSHGEHASVVVVSLIKQTGVVPVQAAPTTISILGLLAAPLDPHLRSIVYSPLVGSGAAAIVSVTI